MALIERGRKRQDVHFPVEHFHLLLEVVDGEGGLAAAGEVRDFEHVGLLMRSLNALMVVSLVERGGWEGKTNARASSSRPSIARSP
jgi:hypothetical protein